MSKRIPPYKLCICCEEYEIDDSVSDFYCKYCYEDKHKEKKEHKLKICEFCGSPTNSSQHYYCKQRRGLI
ncbi:MAG: hypothetical protein GF353_29715 [Candidatus Lokiarchaeota archaeon]|nr:hypothetical protein [Candidatus Lokiarchaeota archaeon]